MTFTLGVVLSDIPLNRLAGDAGSPESYEHSVIFSIAKGVTSRDLVQSTPNRALFEPYLEGALELERRGADAITTTCGFLVPLQAEIGQRLKVPFISSSLLQIPLVYALVQRRIGIITANGDALTSVYLKAAGIDERIPLAIAGLHTNEAFAGPILRNEGQIDLPEVGKAVAGAAVGLLRDYPDIGAFICECHNLPTFSAAIQKETGKPVFDILSLLAFVAQAGDKPAFAGAGST